MNLNLSDSTKVDGKGRDGIERRRALIWGGGAIAGILAYTNGLSSLSLDRAFAQSPGGAHSAMANSVDLGKGDVGILNYAYALEQLEAAFYDQVLKTPYGQMSSEEKQILGVIRDHEVIHREFFKDALKKNAIPDLKVDFSKIDFGNRDSVLSTARTFEDLGVAAYNGAGKMVTKGEYLLIAGKIVSVEARHAAAIRRLIEQNAGGKSGQNESSGNVVNDKGLDRALAPSEVLKQVQPFVSTPVSAKNLG